MATELTILVDNSCLQAGLTPEHGLSVLVSAPDVSTLFDCGASAQTLVANATACGVNLERVQAAVLSHGHYDHTGGLGELCLRRKGLQVLAHPAAFGRRWVERGGQPMKEISCPHSLQRIRGDGADFRPILAAEKLAENLVLSGPIGGPAPGKEMFVVRSGDQMVEDRFEDEICLLIRGGDGWVVLTGCCHRGLRNTLRAAKFLTHGEPIKALIGGLHLRRCDADDFAVAAEIIAEAGVEKVYPCHCTGAAAVEYLAQRLAVQVVGAGSKIVV